MHVDLVQTTTSDGLRLDGALSRVPPAAHRLDAALLVHGVGSNFYGSTLMETLARGLADSGLSVLRINTRGHDSMYLVPGPVGVRRLGAAYERVGDCCQDLTAWLDWLQREAGLDRIALVGHSLGALKAIYLQCHQPHPSVRSVIALSPPRLSYAAFLDGPDGTRFFDTCAAAFERIAEGRGGELMDVAFPHPMSIAASAYIEKYGPDENYNLLRFVDRLPCPTLLTYGERELATGGIAFAGMPEAIAAREYRGARPQSRVIPDADHMYTAARSAVTVAVCQWLAALDG